MSTHTPDARRSWFQLAELLISLSVPVAIIIYTIIQNRNDSPKADKNRRHDLELAKTRYESDIWLAQDQREETTLVDYFNSLWQTIGEKRNILESNVH
jgi:hypothetical protein